MEILSAIDEIPETKANFSHFKFDCLFQLLYAIFNDTVTSTNLIYFVSSSKKHISYSQATNSIYRAIFIYGRSNCMLRKLCDSPEREEFLNCENFYMDAIYIHNKSFENSENNKCEDIYRELCELDKEGKYYIFEVSGNTTKFFSIFAKLIAHPRQRAPEVGKKKSLK